MVFSAEIAKRPTALSSLTAPSAPEAFAPNKIAAQVAEASLETLKTNQGEKKAVSGSKVITEHNYPELVELKIAGRSEKEIADRFDSSQNQIRLHLAQAMSQYRSGRLQIRAGDVIDEAREIGAEKGQEFAQSLTQGFTGYNRVASPVSFGVQPQVSISV